MEDGKLPLETTKAHGLLRGQRDASLIIPVKICPWKMGVVGRASVIIRVMSHTWQRPSASEDFKDLRVTWRVQERRNLVSGLDGCVRCQVVASSANNAHQIDHGQVNYSLPS